MRYNTKVTVTVTVDLQGLEVDSFEELGHAATEKVNKYLNMNYDRSNSTVEDVVSVNLDDWDCQD